MSRVPLSLAEIVERWIADDPDPSTQAEARALLQAEDVDALNDHFGRRLAFGTAGLRAALGCGANRMNRLVVRQTAAGLAARLAEDDGARERGVVIGFDARHQSDVFALDSARVLAAAGFRVHLFGAVVPTPILAFAVTHLGCAAGVQVTASHNPPADNGYKVYWGDGPQIVSPLDEEIRAHIDRVAAGEPPVLADATDPRISVVPDAVADAYFAGVRGLDPRVASPAARTQLRVVYTAMHGVGSAAIERAMDDAGFVDLRSVAAQRDPDPDFPTVAFPNPEEPGALDLAFAEARATEADLIIANDPDADRMSAAIPELSSAGGWRQLRGDEVGWLLADHLLSTTASFGSERLVATTIVSSSLLAAMAARHGVQYRETLTGFKWLARNARALPHLHHVVSYEEALGYSVGSLVADKDGVSAAVVMADVAASLKERGSSVAERLSEIEREYGRYETSQWSLRFDGADALAEMDSLMARLRAALPSTVAGIAVVETRDLATSVPPADVVVLGLGQVGRITVRPSGTEPKCKVYFEVITPADADPPVAVAALRTAMADVLGISGTA